MVLKEENLPHGERDQAGSDPGLHASYYTRRKPWYNGGTAEMGVLAESPRIRGREPVGSV